MVYLSLVRFQRVVKPDRKWKVAQFRRISWNHFGRTRTHINIAQACNLIRHRLRTSTVGRKNKKIYNREIWKTRLNAACEQHGISYVPFMQTLAMSNILLNKQSLQNLAIYEPRSFQSLCVFAKQRMGEINLKTGIEESPEGILTRAMLNLNLKK